MIEKVLQMLGITKKDVEIYIKIGLNYAKQVNEIHQMTKENNEILKQMHKKGA